MKYFILFLLLITHQGILAQPADLFPYRLGSQWGFVNEAGKMIIEPEYDSVGFMEAYPAFMNGVAKVWKKGNAGLIDRRGEQLIKPKYDDLFINEYLINANRAFAGILIKKNGKYGVLDRGMDVVVKPTFDTLFFQTLVNRNNTSDFAYFGWENGRSHQIDRYFEQKDFNTQVYERLIEQNKKKPFTKPAAPNQAKFDADYAEMKPKLPNFVQKNRDKIDAAEVSTFSPKLLEVKKNGKSGMVYATQMEQDKITHWLLEPIYDKIIEVKTYYSGAPYAFLVRKNGKISLLNEKNEVLLEPLYDNYSSWESEGVYLQHQGKKGYFRMADRLLIEPKYESIESIKAYDQTFYKVMLNGKKGLLHPSGQELFGETIQN